MVRSATPPPLFEETENSLNFTTNLDDYIFHISETDEIEPTPAIDMSNENSMGSAVLKAAENCAAKMLRVVMRMSYYDQVGFWYSCMHSPLSMSLSSFLIRKLARLLTLV